MYKNIFKTNEEFRLANILKYINLSKELLFYFYNNLKNEINEQHIKEFKEMFEEKKNSAIIKDLLMFLEDNFIQLLTSIIGKKIKNEIPETKIYEYLNNYFFKVIDLNNIKQYASFGGKNLEKIFSNFIKNVVENKEKLNQFILDKGKII